MTKDSSSAADSPHLGGVQPTWRDLPFACDLVYTIHESQENSFEKLEKEIADGTGKSKTDQMMNFLDKVGIVGNGEKLSPNGAHLAAVYTPPEQETLRGAVQSGIKSSLSRSEQAVWRTLLFERDWLPMLATVNIVATQEVSTQETESRAEEFRERLSHLNEYQSYNSINTWKKKAQTHFRWVEHIGLANSDEREQYKLTDDGWVLHNHAQGYYHQDWPSPNNK